jgi:hypothetical protein
VTLQCEVVAPMPSRWRMIVAALLVTGAVVAVVEHRVTAAREVSRLAAEAQRATSEARRAADEAVRAAEEAQARSQLLIERYKQAERDAREMYRCPSHVELERLRRQRAEQLERLRRARAEAEHQHICRLPRLHVIQP